MTEKFANTHGFPSLAAWSLSRGAAMSSPLF